MNIEDRTELAWIAMDNVQDMDTSRTQYAKAAADGLGWIEIAKELPALDDCVVCTDGVARWLDMRTEHLPKMRWQGHTPTHWHPIADLPVMRAVVGAPPHE